MPRKIKPFRIGSQEFGRGPVEVVGFSTLIEAQKYIQDRWQGPDYIDGSNGFHTDFCTYRLFGFTLNDIGKIRPLYYTDPVTGEETFEGMEYDFKDFTAAA